MLGVLSGHIMSLYEGYLNLFEFDKMTDEDLEKVDKVCNIFVEAASSFVEKEISTCDDLRRFIINRRKQIGIPMSETEIMMLTNATEQTDAYIQDVEDNEPPICLTAVQTMEEV